MKTKITQNEYELLTFLKSQQDQLERMSNRMYYYAKKLLELDDDNWLTDYFNDTIGVTAFLNQVGIDIEETKPLTDGE
jgi:peroxiredoxin family protein